MATKKDLENEVKRLNEKYCKNTKNHLVISRANGGYSVGLTGKFVKKGGKWVKKKHSMSGMADIGNSWHDTANNTLNGLYKADAKGWIKETIKHHEKNKY